MSLINDALKRAKDAQPPAAPATPPAAPMEAVDYRNQPAGLPVYFLPAVLAVVCGAGFFLVKGWDEQRRLTAATAPIVVQAREGAAPVGSAGADDTSEPWPPGIPVGRNFSLEDDSPTRASAAPAPEVVAAVATETATAGGHTYKLQGIFYRTANPSAVINGKSVFIGERVSGARVTAIDRQSVTIEGDGETKVLTLP